MDLQIVAKKRFLNSFKKISLYLKQQWGKKVVEDLIKGCFTNWI